MVDLRLMVANLKFIFLICFQQETLADGIVPTNVNVLFICSEPELTAISFERIVVR